MVMHVAISQRVDVLAGRGERRDALDQAWGPALEKLWGGGVLPWAVPNRPVTAEAGLWQWQPRLIVLTGGNDIGSAPERDATEAALLRWAAGTGTPVLGVCRGMQMVQHHLGAPLARIPGHVACTHQVSGAPGCGLPGLEVNSFHEWGVRQQDLARELEPLYLHADGTVEAARHRSLPWLSVMWHPERPGGEAASGWVGNWLRKVIL